MSPLFDKINFTDSDDVLLGTIHHAHRLSPFARA